MHFLSWCLFTAAAAMLISTGNSFVCPAFHEPGVFVKRLQLDLNSRLPPKDFVKVCKAFDLHSSDSQVHLIGTKPILINRDVVRTMYIYSCRKRPEQRFFDSHQECFDVGVNCGFLMNFWRIGEKGECLNSNAGFLVGTGGIRYVMLRVAWQNPTRASYHIDASGFIVYLTRRLRKYHFGRAIHGELDIKLPPGEPTVTVNHRCPGQCTRALFPKTRYITAVGLYMHLFGGWGRISLWRDGNLVQDLFPTHGVELNNQMILRFDPPIEYRPGDEVRTECNYITLFANSTIKWGFEPDEEMCLSYMVYYPNDFRKSLSDQLNTCYALGGINTCMINAGVKPHIEEECDIGAMRSGDLPKLVLDQMNAKNCFSESGCDPMCAQYLRDELWPSNACYDPNRAAKMAHVMAGNFDNFLWRARLTQAGELISPEVADTIRRTLEVNERCKAT